MVNWPRIVGIFGLAIIPLILCSALVIRNNTATHQARIVEERVNLARAASQSVGSYVAGNLTTVRALAMTPLVQNADRVGTVPDFLTAIVTDNPDWDGIGMIRSDGTTLTGSLSTSGTVNLADRSYFQQVMTTGQPTVSEPIIGRIRGVVTVVLAAPVTFTSGERGALVVPLSMSRLASELRDLDGGLGAQLLVVDASARVFVHPDPGVANQLISLAGAPEVDMVREGQTGARVTRLTGNIARRGAASADEQLAAYAPVSPYGWGVIVYEPAALVFAPVQSAFVGQLALLMLSIFVVAGTTALFGRRLARAYQVTVRARRQAEAARAVAEQAEQRAELLAWMSEELDRASDYEATLQQVAARIVPTFADWCAVDLLDANGELRRVAVARASPISGSGAADATLPAPPSAAGGVRTVIQGSQPIMDRDADSATLAGYVADANEREALASRGVIAALAVPMVARERCLGALTLLATSPRPPFDPSDLEFASDAAARAALAVDNMRLRDDLERAIRNRDEYFAATSHDLRTPLTAIRGAAQMQGRLLRRLDDAAAEPFRPGLGIIEAATSRLARLASGLLDLARLEMGRPLDLDRAEMDLVALTRRMVAEVQQTTDRMAIRLDTEAAVEGEWDAGRLERVIANLLDNAVKYGGEAGTIEVRVRHEHRAGREVAIVEVQDYGVGIPPSDLPYVFDQFHRGSNVVGKIAGTGLGLAGARHIVEQHGGTITVASTVGEGTTMRVELPIEPVANSAAAPSTERSE